MKISLNQFSHQYQKATSLFFQWTFLISNFNYKVNTHHHKSISRLRRISQEKKSSEHCLTSIIMIWKMLFYHLFWLPGPSFSDEQVIKTLSAEDKQGSVDETNVYTADPSMLGKNAEPPHCGK